MTAPAEPAGLAMVRVAEAVWVGFTTDGWALRHGEPTRADRDAGRALPPWRAREHLASRALLRLLLAACPASGCRRAAAADLAAEAGGRPYLRGHPRVGVNLSHAGGHVAAAVGDGRRVGVDVEVGIDPSTGMLRRCCEPADVARLRQWTADERAAEFTAMWSAMEACVKATGDGLAGAPWRVGVRPGQRRGRWDSGRCGEVSWVTLRAGRPAVSCAFLDGGPP